MKTKFNSNIHARDQSFGWACAAAVVLLFGVLAGSAQTNKYLFTGSKTNITLNPGTYYITAYGAQGGGSGFDGNGGLGAEMEGEFAFSGITTLTLLVGGTGVGGADWGGGGGSFVVQGGTPLVVAGGGGGSGSYGPGYPGLITTSGATEYAPGGTSGGGGGGGGYAGGGSGGGFLGNGGSGLNYYGAVTGGFSFTNGGAGGTDPYYSGGTGGFGGGGGGNGQAGSGGGGGYSGGGAGNGGFLSTDGGGGGGSIIASSAITLVAEVSGIASPDGSPNGEIIITAISLVPVTPALGITTVSNLPVVVWPAAATNFVLQMTTNLASGNWVTVTNGIPFSGLQITNPPGTAFFRLH